MKVLNTQIYTKWMSRQMSRAGFVYCPSENEPAIACCFYCLIELEDWEPDDDPDENGSFERVQKVLWLETVSLCNCIITIMVWVSSDNP
ncbi:hypothetical protein CRUP_004475 [Coryphaenoides rupestris]|nr:hypothetical protein CRUP_004475 [Coryphaenoides rupestris]